MIAELAQGNSLELDLSVTDREGELSEDLVIREETVDEISQAGHGAAESRMVSGVDPGVRESAAENVEDLLGGSQSLSDGGRLHSWHQDFFFSSRSRDRVRRISFA